MADGSVEGRAKENGELVAGVVDVAGVVWKPPNTLPLGLGAKALLADG